MSIKPVQVRLGAFFNPTGHHAASWRHPDADETANTSFRHYAEITRTAERGRFDLVFLADNQCVRSGSKEAVSRAAQYVANFEPITLISALAAVTERIGLVCTATTSYNEPYHVARKFASIDHISGGRAGWNIVTSGYKEEAWNFGRDEHYEHDARYDRAREFTQVVLGLWDSWDDDAYVHDKKSGIYFDVGRMHTLEHKGEHFRVRGPLNVPRPPQGYPVLVQAGSSEVGRGFAAEFAEVIFTSQLTLESGQAFCADIRARAGKLGRNPEHIKVLPGLATVVGASESEANEKYEQLQALIDPIVGRELLGMLLGGVDLSPYDIDGPLPENLPRSQASTSGFDRIVAMARRENLTIRQLYIRSATGRGQRLVKGTPAQIADDIQHWVESGACDGFNIMPTHLPGGLDEFVDKVVPELQRRGIFRKEYEGRTLREHLGLPRPASRYARAR